MANLTITIPDNIYTRVVDSFCFHHRYKPIINGQPNPETKPQFFKKRTIEFIKDSIKVYESENVAGIERRRRREEVERDIRIS